MRLDIRRLAFAGMTIMLSHGLSFAAPSLRYNSWHIYWDSNKVDRAAKTYEKDLNILCVFAVHFNASGDLAPAFASLPNTLRDIRRNAPSAKIFLTAVNDVVDGKKTKLKDPNVVHSIVSDPAKTSDHIAALLNFADGFDGIDIDYENLDRRDREDFSNFIAKLADAAHKKKKLLSVVVEPKTTEVTWNGAGAMDWRAIAQSADLVKIMAYYLHYPGGDPGPVAPAPWTADIAKFALTQIPKEKLSVALVLNGVDWSDGDKGKIIDFDTAMDIVKTNRIRMEWDGPSQSPWFRYNDGSKNHVIWFENRRSLEEKVKQLQRLGITQIGLWRIGSGDAAFWDNLR